MAKREKQDIGLNGLLDQLERQIFQLKIQYEKYFTGVERQEPMQEHNALTRRVRELSQRRINNTQQKYRFTQLKARFSSLEMYWKRNLIQIERGTHPKMKFRADIKEQRRLAADFAEQEKQLQPKKPRATTEEDSYRSVYEKLLEARKKTGQSTSISYDSIRSTLEKQSKAIKSQYKCDGVKFKISIKDGKAKMKAVPIKKKE